MKTEPEYMPTPEEIRQACLAIQATWSEAEKARRRAMIPATRKPRGKSKLLKLSNRQPQSYRPID